MNPVSPRAILLSLVILFFALPPARALTVESRRINPASGRLETNVEELDPKTVGVVVVDMWNWHWCKTSTQRVAALVPRMNRCLAAARSLGMTVFLCPTDVADNYAGSPMFEKAMAVEPLPVPQVVKIECPAAPDGGGCTCGGERCLGNYGWDGMHPDLVVGADDLMPNDAGRLYALCKKKGVKHLIYMGVHTQVCLLGKSIGLRAMTEAGFDCFLARDLTDAHGRYEPGVETPDDFTAKVVAHFERHLARSLDFADTLRRNGLWQDDWLVDFVRHAPWGVAARPQLFENEFTLTLTEPRHPGCEIHYSLDGSPPTAGAPLYSKPLVFTNDIRVRAAAFVRGRQVTLVSESLAARLGPKPPTPDVYLAELKPWRAAGMGHSPSFDDTRLSPGVNPPQPDRSNEGKPILLRGQTFRHGLGVHAPNQLVYEIKPDWERFVGVAGVDEHLLDVNNGSNRAMRPSVVFRVFIDGAMAAESPMMRISFEPWRFNVSIPPGAKRISLCATDGGDGHEDDLANWAEAGFALRR